ncbi:hypothetical protein JMJ55_11700 [Belnapia sp. T6]|uniref:Peptidase propeptide and YPEB domain-containing protein n=1 Tax=Belnapia mucosa TaxID=2804532 RepID=A0ABS1V4E1_9PROT|nr:hypothetical protein [Belnapia mucosa]MBL6455991.1 hypothetical protein [Belnapia mucosa]
MPYALRPALLALLLMLAGPALAQQAAVLTPDQLATVLRARGFTDLEGVERDGDTFRIARSMRYGEPVENLRIDAATGLPREQPPLTEGQARELLRARGYAEVTEIGRDGDAIRLRAVREGTPSELTVDARTGAVRQ